MSNFDHKQPSKPKLVLKSSESVPESKSEYTEYHVSANYAPRDQPQVTVECPPNQPHSHLHGSSGGFQQFQTIPKYHKTSSYTWSPGRSFVQSSPKISKPRKMKIKVNESSITPTIDSDKTKPPNTEPLLSAPSQTIQTDTTSEKQVTKLSETTLTQPKHNFVHTVKVNAKQRCKWFSFTCCAIGCLIIISTILVIGILLFAWRDSKRHKMTTSTPETTKVEKICENEVCLQASKTLLESIDSSVDPCDDFYHYACGNWSPMQHIPETLIQPGFKHTDQSIMLAYSFRQELRQVLDNMHHNDTKEKGQTEDIEMQNAVQFYHQCVKDELEMATPGCCPGQKVNVSVWEPCIENMLLLFPVQCAQLYIGTYGKGDFEITRLMVRNLLFDIKNTFAQVLNESGLTDLERAGPLHEIASPRFFIGLPETSKSAEIKNDSTEPISSDYLQKIKQEANEEGWSMASVSNTPHLSFHRKSSTIPMAILRAPYFHQVYPAALIYGALGSVLAHHIFHIAQSGANLLSEKAWQRAEKLPECIAEQEKRSNTLNARKTDEPIYKLKPEDQLKSDIRESGAHWLLVAYRAFESTRSPVFHSILPNMTHLSGKQLFFLSYAHISCSTKEDVPELMNLALSNMDQFSKAFKCPIGTAMNPKEKCLFW